MTDTTSGLLSITEPNDPGAVTDFDGYISAWVGKLDGQYAGEPGDVRMILGAATVAHMVGQYKTNTSPTSAYRAVLDLAGAVEILDNTLDVAPNKQLTYPEILEQLLGAEVAARRERYLSTRTNMAHLPFQRTLDCSLNESYPNQVWKDKARTAIGECDAVIVLVGQGFIDAAGDNYWSSEGVLNDAALAMSAGVDGSQYHV